jgi:hypothetical protein
MIGCQERRSLRQHVSQAQRPFILRRNSDSECPLQLWLWRWHDLLLSAPCANAAETSTAQSCVGRNYGVTTSDRHPIKFQMHPPLSTLIIIRALKELFCGFRVGLESICGCTCESWLELPVQKISWKTRKYLGRCCAIVGR